MRLEYYILSLHGRLRTTNGQKQVVGLKFGRFAAAIKRCTPWRRKVCNTTNSFLISDNQGVMLVMFTPQEGQHGTGRPA